MLPWDDIRKHVTQATGGTFAFTVGASTSDPVPYDASPEMADAALIQASNRERKRLADGGAPYVAPPIKPMRPWRWYHHVEYRLRICGSAARHVVARWWESWEFHIILVLLIVVAVLVVGLIKASLAVDWFLRRG